jgi:hypothetical protein
MLKSKINKADFDALPEALKAYYKQDGDNYLLQSDEFDELRRAKDRVTTEAKTEKERADRLQTQVDELVANPDKQKDITTLENSWKQKLADQKTAYEAKQTRLTEQLQKTLVADQALRIATELAGDKAEILVPHIEKRLKADLDGDTPVTRVLDAAGKLSASTFDDLKKEFVDNSKYSAIIIASNANGGAGSKRTEASTVLKNKKFAELNDAERKQYFSDDPEGFRKAAAAHQQEVNENLQRSVVRKF